MEAAFEDAKKQIESDIIFGGYEEVWKNLNRLRFQIDKERLIECEELDLKKAKDRQLLQDAMKLSFNRIRDLHTAMKIQIQKIQTLVDQYRSNKNQETRQSLSRALANFFVAADGRIIYSDDSGSSAGGASLTPEELLAGGHLLGGGEVWIDGLIPAGILDLLLDSMREGTEKLLANKRYDLDTLHKVRDFRTLTNLLYVVRLAKKLGISTELNPVLSFPLGPYSVSIIEAALAYETILTGRIHTLPEKARPEMVPIITKILDREGNLIWEHQPKWTPVLSPRVSRLTGEILRKVMLVGTGKKARNAVKLFDISIPSFGKTGTANRFTNSSFVGMIPGPNRETGQLDVNRGYVIAAYVGYDDNRPMKHKRVEIYGASGALPLWIDTAQAIVNTDGYRQGIEPADIAFEPLTIKLPRQGKGFVKVPVSPVTGLPDSGEASRRWPRVLAEGENPSGMIGLSRRFDPLEGEKK
jgi:hypothetical protein